MLVFGIVLALLLALVLLAERAGTRVLHGDRPPHLCVACDRRYQPAELVGGLMPLCPRGHPVEAAEGRSALTTALLAGLLGFAAVAGLLLLTGVVPGP